MKKTLKKRLKEKGIRTRHLATMAGIPYPTLVAGINKTHVPRNFEKKMLVIGCIRAQGVDVSVEDFE